MCRRLSSRLPFTGRNVVVVLVLVGLAVGAVSLLPLRIKNAVGTTGAFHGLGHLTAFALIAAITVNLAQNFTRVVTLCLAVLSYAVVLEMLEALVYGSPFELYDVRTDAIGIIFGAVAYIPF